MGLHVDDEESPGLNSGKDKEMTGIESLIASIQATDREFLDGVMQQCKGKNETLIEKIRSSNRATIREWKKSFHAKSQSVTDKTTSWMTLINSQKASMTQSLVEDYAKKLRLKNEEILSRLSKGRKRSPAYIAELKTKFDATAEEMITTEKLRLETVDQTAKSKGEDQLRKHSMFQKAETDFLETYAREEKEFFQRFDDVTAKSDGFFRSNIMEADAKFRRSLTDKPDGPSGSILEEGNSKLTVMIATRNTKRHAEIAGWFREKDDEFVKLLKKIEEDNKRTLTSLDKEFEDLFKAS